MSASEEIVNSLCYSTGQIDKIESLLFVERDGKFGGYKFDLLMEEYPATFLSLVTCSRCEGIMRDASGVGSPQEFMCSVCVEGSSHSALGPNREVVSNLIIWCPLRSRGCEWEGHISSSETHLDSCMYLCTECGMSCGAVVKRIDMERHVNGECPLRVIMCEHCTESHKQAEMKLHLEECVMFPMHCTKGCGDILPRRDMQSHGEEMCPNSLLECGYRKYGCDVVVMRKDLNTHTNEYRLQHMEMKIEFLESEIREDGSFEEELAAKSSEMELIQSKINSIETENVFLKINLHQLSKESEVFRKMLHSTYDIPKIEEILFSKMNEIACNSEKINFFVDKISDIIDKNRVPVVYEFNKKTETIGNFAFIIQCENLSTLELTCHLTVPVGTQFIFETSCTLMNQFHESTNAVYRDSFTIGNKHFVPTTAVSTDTNNEYKEHRCVIHKISKSLLRQPGILHLDTILLQFFFNIDTTMK